MTGEECLFVGRGKVDASARRAIERVVGAHGAVFANPYVPGYGYQWEITIARTGPHGMAREADAIARDLETAGLWPIPLHEGSVG